MLLGQVPRILARRWYIALLGLALTAGGVLGVVRAVGPSYTVTSEVLLMPPSTVVPKGSNPYLQLGGLESIGSVASKAMTSDQTAREVRTRFGPVDYGVDLDRLAAAPMVIIQVEADSASVATNTEAFLDQRFTAVIGQLQAQSAVPTDSLISTQPIVRPDRPKVGHKSQLRMGIVSGALGVMGTLLLTAGVDAILGRRRRADIDASASGEDSEGDPQVAAALDDEVTDERERHASPVAASGAGPDRGVHRRGRDDDADLTPTELEQVPS